MRNHSITTGIFPNAWKRARVSPIFKEDPGTDAKNYRPISVLPVVSKLIERVVFNQWYEYLSDNNNLLTEAQPGFRPMFSTGSTALLTYVHSHNLRNSELNYHVPRPRAESAKGSLHYRGSVLWEQDSLRD